MLIGLDKQTIKPTVVGIDLDKLRNNDNVVIDTEGLVVPMYDYRKDKEVMIKHINIVDDIMFNRLTIGTYKADMGVGLFCYLDISKMGVDDCNLVPYTIEGFKAYADKCIAYIESRYGVKLQNNDYKGEVMEMNVTITLESKFDNYSHLLRLMRKAATGGRKRYKAYEYDDVDREVSGFKLYNKSMSKKVYDKKRQMEKEKEIKIVLDKEYMRIEDTLMEQNKIKNAFNTYNIGDITDDEVAEYMRKSIKDDLIAPLEKHIEASNKRLLKIAKEEKKNNNKKWIQSFIISALTETIKGVPILLDKQQIIDVIKTVDKKNYNRTIKRAANDLDKLNIYSGNIDKLNEIKFKCNIS